MKFLLPSILLFALFVLSGCKDDEPMASASTTVVLHGKNYETVSIGDQTWLAVNYAGPGGVTFDAANSKPEYGKYYTMAELSSIVLPDGWRIPTRADFEKLAQFQGLTVPTPITNSNLVKGFISKNHRNNLQGTNTTGFNALPGGYFFGELAAIDGDIAEFWTSEGITLSIQEAGQDLKQARMAFYQSDNSPDYRFNVRLVKD